MTLDQFIEERPRYSSLRAMVRATGMTRHSLRVLEAKAGKLEPEHQEPEIAEGSISPSVETEEWPLPPEGTVHRFILTSAQNNTKVHNDFCVNLWAYARHIDAIVMVSRFTYNKSAYEFQNGSSPKTKRGNETAAAWDPMMSEGIFVDNRVQLAPGLVFCGELDVIPTAENPLSGLDQYTGQSSGIVPHAKMALVSIPTMKHDPAKLMYTTGTITRRNYVGRKTGQKADFHHVFGALIVEVDSGGNWWCRQLIANKHGSFHDLDVFVGGGQITKGQKVAAVVLGDVHAEQSDREVLNTSIGMLKTLKPRNVILHDLLDFRARNHHDIDDALMSFKKMKSGQDAVASGFHAAHGVVALIKKAVDTRIHVVRSNHDEALDRWLDETDYRKDPINALVFLKLQLRRYQDALAGNQLPAIQNAMYPVPGHNQPHFLHQDESLEIEGVECGIHGHVGPNGARGTPRAFSRIGPRTFTGHSHSAGIVASCWTVGIMGSLDQGYNKGPSSWTHTHGLIYKGGKRALITIPVNCKHKWRA